jgi:hypothetical protein
MKAIIFLFTIIGFGALMPGTSFAGQAPDKTTDNRPAGGPADAAHPPTPDSPKPFANNPRNKPPAFNSIRQSLLNRPSAAVTANGLKINRAVMPQQVKVIRKLPPAIAPVAPLAGIVRNRGADTAVIGQSMRSSLKTSAAAISGTGRKPKP